MATAVNISEIEIKDLVNRLATLKAEIQKIIVGQDEIIEQIVIALMAGGHCLLEGVPGLAKTLLVRTMAQAMDLPFRRIQFTPDLMPADIIGTEILEEDEDSGKRFFKFIPGPLFANLILADEINRTPPKTQSALLEAMQEFEVTYAGKTYPLDKPFFILATQNPIEQAGTYPLPEAQLDRFLLYIKIGYPSSEEEVRILKSTTGSKKTKIEPIINGKAILLLQQLVREVEISDQLIAYVSEFIRATRPLTTDVDYVKEWVQWGAGPRAGQALILTAKARALFHGRFAVIPEDIHSMAYPALRHRVLMNFKAASEQVTSDDLTGELIKILQKRFL
ncbi:AAA family ATPase [Olivibacter sitiensis]|uniref:AAA family ATPase n=1 Tax=Olivibacter sitiensis TaxID=376470 RepID=UPI00041F16AF|nr:MoxR family ATPase [Olivibacter sitiensis]